MSGPPETFTLGLVLGPGGNARETYLREKFGFDSRNDDAIRWRPDMAVVSGIAGLEAAPDGERAAVSACKRLGACGLSSVPSWLRPYECLSNGEAARVDVAAALAAHQGGGAGAYCVVDDFACVVNRDAARSIALADRAPADAERILLVQHSGTLATEPGQELLNDLADRTAAELGLRPRPEPGAPASRSIHGFVLGLSLIHI